MQRMRVPGFVWVLCLSGLVLFIGGGIPALAQGAWVYVDDRPEDVNNTKQPNDSERWVESGGTTCVQKLTWAVPKQYSASVTCTGNWSSMPMIMRPGEKIQVSFQASTKGWDSRGGYHLWHGCIVSAGLKGLDRNGKVLWGRGAGLKDCKAEIGNARGTSAQCQVQNEWVVPPGKPGEGLIFSPSVNGFGGTCRHHYKYVFKAESELPPASGGEVGPIPSGSPPDPESPTNYPDTWTVGPVVARLTVTSREVEVARGSLDNVLFATQGMEIHEGDHIFTGEDSIAIIAFGDLSTLKIGPDSEVIIGPRREREIRIRRGVTWAEIIQGNPVKIRSNLSILGIKGTSLSVDTNPEGTTLRVLEHVVEIQSTVTGESVLVHRGQEVSATRKGLGEVRSFDVAAERARWSDLFRRHGISSGGNSGSEPGYRTVSALKVASTFNPSAVRNGPSVPVVVTTPKPILVRTIQTYHWNGGRGSSPGTIAIHGPNGRVYGPWPAEGLANLSGKGGPPSLYWRVMPDLVLPAGKYRIIDSDAGTWATNGQAGNRGFFKMEYQEVETKTAAPEINLGGNGGHPR